MKKFLISLSVFFLCLVPINSFARERVLDAVAIFPNSIGSDGVPSLFLNGKDVYGVSTDLFNTFQYSLTSFSTPIGYAVNFNYPYNFNEFDYWVSFSMYHKKVSGFDLVPSRMRVKFDNEGVSNNVVLSDFSFKHLDSSYGSLSKQGFQVVARIPSSFSSAEIRDIMVDCTGSGGVAGSYYCQAWLFQVPKADEGSLAGVQEAIYEQTATLNDSILNGNPSTQPSIDNGSSRLDGATSDFNDMQGKLDEYENLENEYFGKYDSAVGGISDTVSGFTFNQILPARNWLSTQMTTCYDKMGGFKFYVVFPIILAISLIFIGGSISKKY